jgi:hypothetical protein
VTLGQREKRLAAGLLAALAVAAVLRLRNVGDGDAGDGVGARELAGGRPGRASEEPAARQVVDLDVASLQPREERFEIGRDPFRYGARPTPPPPPPPPFRPPEPAPTIIAAAPEPLGTPKPVPPNADHLRFLGSFGPADRRIAVVLAGADLHNVREGAVLEGKFVVHEIGYESLAIAFVGFPDEPPRRLPVGGG